MAMTLLPESAPEVVTATGMLLATVPPLPNCPSVLVPQAAIVPSEHRAKLCKKPPVMATTDFPERAPPRVTTTGTVLFTTLPFPN